MTDPKAKENRKVFPFPCDVYPYASAKTPMEELLFNDTHPTLKWTETQSLSPQMTDMSTPQWQSTTATSGHPSPQMNVMTTPKWHTTTPTSATQSLPITTLPIPKWTHPPSSHLANNNIRPTNLIDIIHAIKKMPPQKPTPPEFSFKLTNKAAKQNYMVLMHKYKGSLAASLESQRDLMAGCGLEFRDKAALSHLFARHPNWNRMTQILRNGSEWPLEPLAKDKQCADVAEALAFRNLETTRVHPCNPSSYCLPLPLVKATKIPNILIATMNIQKQSTINEYGRSVPKDCLTLDQSFEWSSGTSINSRVIAEELLPCMFRSCIR